MHDTTESWYEGAGYEIEPTPLQLSLQYWITETKANKRSSELYTALNEKYSEVQQYLNFTSKEQFQNRMNIKKLSASKSILLLEALRETLLHFSSEDSELMGKFKLYNNAVIRDMKSRLVAILNHTIYKDKTVAEIYRDAITKKNGLVANTIGQMYLHIVNYGEWEGTLICTQNTISF